MKLYTMGFAKKNAEKFFNLLIKNNVELLMDVRLNNVSQLAGFTKKEDLKYFLKEICSINYLHYDFLAPTKEILNGYKNKEISWNEYENKFLKLLEQREVIDNIDNKILNNACLLCSESSADECHRRLVAEYLQSHFPDIEIEHL